MANEEDDPFVSDADAATASSASAELRTRFGRALRQARRASGMSPHEIETLTGVPEAELSDIETGRADAALATITALAKAVHKELWELLA